MKSLSLAISVVLASGAVEAGDFPFIAIRSMGSGAKNPRFTETIFAANEKYPGLVDEIWFGGCSPYGTAPLWEALVEPQLKYRAECERRGIPGCSVRLRRRSAN